MTNLVKNLLRAGVFVLGVVFAFAFTQPAVDCEFTGYWGKDANGVWHQITSQMEEGVHYSCEEPRDENDYCLYDAKEGNPVDPQTNSLFVILP